MPLSPCSSGVPFNTFPLRVTLQNNSCYIVNTSSLCPSLQPFYAWIFQYGCCCSVHFRFVLTRTSGDFHVIIYFRFLRYFQFSSFYKFRFRKKKKYWLHICYWIYNLVFKWLFYFPLVVSRRKTSRSYRLIKKKKSCNIDYGII